MAEQAAKRPRAEGSFKVAVLGAAGGIGQPLSLLMKLCPLVRELSMYDIVNTPGVGADVSHIDTPAKVSAYIGAEQLDDSLKGCDVVIITAGRAQKPGESRDDLFRTNAKIVKILAEGCARNCPTAMVCIITNPVNSAIPIASEVFKKAGCYDPRRFFGINMLDVVRTRTFVSELKDVSLDGLWIPVVGGHSGPTILPLLSQVRPAVSFTDEEVVSLTDKIQDAANVVINLKAGTGSSTLSIAYAASKFATSLMEAMLGKDDVVQCAYVKSDVTEASYFASPLRLGKNGVEEVLGLGQLSEFEKKKLEAEVLPELLLNIKKGEDYFASQQ